MRNSEYMIKSFRILMKYLCSKIGAEKVYSNMAQTLNRPGKFEELCVQILSDMLIKEKYLEDFRERLKYCTENKDTEIIQLF